MGLQAGNTSGDSTTSSSSQKGCNNQNQCNQSWGSCVNKCVNKWLVNPTKYAYGLLASGFVYGVGSTPVAGGVLTAGQYAGAVAGGYIGAYWGASSLAPWVAGGATVGGGIVTGAGVVGAFGAGYALGTLGQCTLSCSADPCSY
jgi:hypothetical protein